jgi:hypothetical protein
MPLRLVQLVTPGGERFIAAATDGAMGRRVNGVATVISLAQAAIAANSTLGAMADAAGYREEIDLGEALRSKRIMAPIDHPDPARVFLTGTGLTHLGSADARDRMHAKAHSADASDSMKMFRMGRTSRSMAERSRNSREFTSSPLTALHSGSGSRSPMSFPTTSRNG